MKREYKTTVQPRFTADRLDALPSDDLKRWSKYWGGKGTERKALCIEIVLAGLTKPEVIKQRLSKLTAQDKTALAILKAQGGYIMAQDLEQILRCYGYDVPYGDTNSYYSPRCEYVPQLVKQGVVLCEHTDSDYYFNRRRSGIYPRTLVFADERLLAQLTKPPKIRSLELTPAQVTPGAATFRRPSHLLMDCLSITRALQQLQGLRLTQAQIVRVADSRKFAKLLGWENGATYDGFTLPGIVDLVIAIWVNCGWLEQGNGVLELTITPDYFNNRSEVEIASQMLNCFLQENIWMYPTKDYPVRHEASLRAGLLYCMQALPAQAQSFAVADFVKAVYQRIGQCTEVHALYLPAPYQLYGMTDAEYQEKVRQWEKEHEAEWTRVAHRCAREILSGWMYWLGLVALQTAPADALIFGLTELGQQVLAYGNQQSAPETVAEAPGPAWIVQPNFDVIVYLSSVSSEQLAFMEAHGERQQAQMHTARYVLTRESVHRGLDGGTTVAEVIATLRAGTNTDLPQNVEQELRAWATLREQITIYANGRVIAFDTKLARDQALQAGLQGRAMGELYVLAPPSIALPQLFQGVFGAKKAAILTNDYAKPPLRNVKLSEAGTVELQRGTNDLLLEGQIARCTELAANNSRVITPASLKVLKQAGVSAKDFIAFLDERASNGVPELLEVMIRNHLGTRAKVEGLPVYALRVTDKRLYTALVTSLSLAEYILDVPGPDTILINQEDATEFMQIMEEIGVRLAEYKQVAVRPDWLETIKDAKLQQRRHKRW